MKKLSEQFNTIAVKKGEFFMIDLADNGASTGYMWTLDVTVGKARTVRHEYVDPTPDPEGQMAIGKSMINRTIMQAEDEGTIEIDASWKRPWETGTAPAKSFKFTVKVG